MTFFQTKDKKRRFFRFLSVWLGVNGAKINFLKKDKSLHMLRTILDPSFRSGRWKSR